jgi:hypothetical protein
MVASLMPGFGGPTCKVDGMVTGCRLAFGVLSSGAGVLLNPGARTTPRVVVYHGQSVLAIYRATYDGYQGFIPVNASYTGNGNFSFAGTPFPPGYYRDHARVPDTDFSVLNQTGNNEQFLASSPQDPTLLKINHAFGDAASGFDQGRSKKKNPCKDFFLRGRSLEEVSAIFSSFWKSAVHSPSLPATASTANGGQGMAATLKLGNAFFADDNTTPGTDLSFSHANDMYLTNAYQLTPRQNRAMTILHEFAHALGLIPSDNPTVDPSGAQSLRNDATIYEKCKDILNSLPLRD